MIPGLTNYAKDQRNYMNDLLKARGIVFLNEVYDALGIDRTAMGALVGWSVGSEENVISFGAIDAQKESVNVFLDFNVQGFVFNELPGPLEMPT